MVTGTKSPYSPFDRMVETYAPSPSANYLPLFDTNVLGFPSGLVARTEIEAKLKLKRQDVNWAVVIAEANQSIRLIGQALIDVFWAYKMVKHGQYGAAMRSLFGLRGELNDYGDVPVRKPHESVADYWLRLQYGWLPVLNDVKNIFDSMQKSFLDRGYRFHVTRDIRIPIDKKIETVTSQGIKSLQTDSGYQGCKVRLDYTLRSDALSLASHLGLTNPFVVAWERKPFSFIFDWLVPLGDWLSSLDADFGLTFLGGTRTLYQHHWRKGKVRMVKQPFIGSPTSLWDNVSLDCEMKQDYVNRSVYASTPFPLPYVKSPVSPTHALNAIALGVGILSGAKVPSYIKS